jgi:hypothetical protein
VGERQKFCSEPACKSASKTQSQRRWLDKPGNQDYFSGPAHVERVRRWRQTHPGYWKKPGIDRDTALQDESMTQTIDLSKQSGTLTSDALQDLIFAQPFVFVGLMANLTGSALQDEIATFLHRLHTCGRDIIHPPVTGENDDAQTDTQPTASAPRAPPIQLGGSAPGTR